MNWFLDGITDIMLVSWRVFSEIYRWPVRMGDKVFTHLKMSRVKGKPQHLINLVEREALIMRWFYRPGEHLFFDAPHPIGWMKYCSDPRLGSATSMSWLKNGWIAESRNAGAAVTAKDVVDIRFFVRTGGVEVLFFSVHDDCKAFKRVRAAVDNHEESKEPLVDDIRMTPERVRGLYAEFSDLIEAGKLQFDFSEFCHKRDKSKKLTFFGRIKKAARLFVPKRLLSSRLSPTRKPLTMEEYCMRFERAVAPVATAPTRFISAEPELRELRLASR